MIVIEVEAVYFQCARALVRSRLWDPAQHVPAGSLPTPGNILGKLSENRVGGDTYDAAWAERAKRTLW